MPQPKNSLEAMLEETRAAVAEARLATRRSRQLLAGMRQDREARNRQSRRSKAED